MLINPDGSGQSEPGACPAGRHISPDGTRVVGPVYTPDFIADTRIQGLDGSNQITFPGRDEIDAYSSWSPDGQFIGIFDVLATSERGNESILSYARADGVGGKQQLGRGQEAEIPWSNYGRIALWNTFDWNDVFFTATFTPGGCCGTYVAQSVIGFSSIDWDPTSDRLGYNPSGTIVEASPDLTGEQVLATGPEVGSAGPRYSPDGQKVLYGTGDIYSINQDGTGKTNLTNNPAGDKNPVWSPDSQKIAFQSNRDGDYDIYVMNRDGSNVLQLTNEAREEPLLDWQPILKGYARPKAATPTYTPLVPAYTPCTAPNRQHAPSLSFGSCAPPNHRSPTLTVGVGDGSPAFSRSVGHVRLKALPGIPGGPDDADMAITLSLTNVMRKADLSDYTGELGLDLRFELTDSEGPVSQTTQSFDISATAPCTATASTIDGATCAIDTTAEALIPNAITEGARAIFALGPVRVRDGGTDEDADTPAGDGLLATQGVFVP